MHLPLQFCNKKITLKIIEDFNYKLGKKSITKDIESIKGSDILKYIKNISDITTNENELISCEFYEQYNGYYIFTNDKNQECFKYNITWEQDMKSFKINNGLLSTSTCGEKFENILKYKKY
ncbi:hypothetical protein [Spiroplasma ixodetis]|uniref:Uncharacterized protein n=1 Tax=Spiroplasma ixodetis TaxID=2141 RepID=A0ABN6SYD6_9MOLU|nr:hypothetical protein [Spiroplasma ixodetis]BDT04153.1 hypothetical protein SHM_17990 [Spiroplasma ixodetis]